MSIPKILVLSDNASDVKYESPRSAFYKKPINRYNYKLNIEDEDCPQEIRRQQLLLNQKKNRDTAFNSGRAILDTFLSSEEEILDDAKVDESRNGSLCRYKQYANKLMMSEWMLDVPEDYMENWIMVPCPEGRRTLVVACKGKTKAYSRRGERLGKFNSALPGGNSSQHNNSCTILDCIWLKKEKMYYALDVLAWSNQPLLNCEAEFRLFWLRSKFADTLDLKERHTPRNTFPILALPSVACNEDPSDTTAKSIDFQPLDGFLFFHRQGQYTQGRTPLVTWLKPFMLNEVLGIAIPTSLEDKPDGYIDYRHYIESQKSRPKNKKTADDEMDVVNTES